MFRKKNQQAEIQGLDPAGAGKPQKKKKKMNKKLKRRIIFGTAAVVIIAGMTLPKYLVPEVPPIVMTEAVGKGDVRQILSTSGLIQSERQKTYYSPITGNIALCKVEQGGTVEEGKELVTFDTEDLELAAKEASLTNWANQNDYQDNLNKNTDNHVIQDQEAMQVMGYQSMVNGKEQEIRYVNECISNLEYQITALERDPDEDMNQKKLNKKYLEYQKQIKDYQTKLAVLQDELADLNKLLSEHESEQKTAENGTLTESEINKINAQRQLSTLAEQKAKNELEKASKGIFAEFSGIVTESEIYEGTYLTEGAKMFTVESNREVKVEIFISKYDLEKVELGQKADIEIGANTYKGSLTVLNKVAEKNDQGTPMIKGEIHIENADENVYLGMEAKIKLLTGEAENVVIIPVQAVNTGKDGDFCYIVENGIITKRNIVTGISSDEYIEIKEGLTEGDRLVSSLPEMLTEGMTVTEMPAEGMGAAMSGDAAAEAGSQAAGAEDSSASENTAGTDSKSEEADAGSGNKTEAGEPEADELSE